MTEDKQPKSKKTTVRDIRDGKWHWVWGYDKLPAQGSPLGWRRIVFGFIKIKPDFPEGVRLSREWYKGFFFNWIVWFPFERGAKR